MSVCPSIRRDLVCVMIYSNKGNYHPTYWSLAFILHINSLLQLLLSTMTTLIAARRSCQRLPHYGIGITRQFHVPARSTMSKPAFLPGIGQTTGKTGYNAISPMTMATRGYATPASAPTPTPTQGMPCSATSLAADPPKSLTHIHLSDCSHTPEKSRSSYYIR